MGHLSVDLEYHCALGLYCSDLFFHLMFDTSKIALGESCVRVKQRRTTMTNAEKKIAKLLLEVCEDLLPNTRVANNAKIKKVLEGVREIVEAK